MLKTAMITAPIVQLLEFDHAFIVIIDASGVLVSSMLRGEFGKGLQLVCDDTQKLNSTECHYVD